MPQTAIAASVLLAIILVACVLSVFLKSRTKPRRCTDCGYPLILRKDDDPNNPAHEPEEYEDDNNGLCGNCACADRISRATERRNRTE